MQFDLCHPCSKDSMKKELCFKHLLNRNQGLIGFDPYYPFKTLNKFIYNSPIYLKYL